MDSPVPGFLPVDLRIRADHHEAMADPFLEGLNRRFDRIDAKFDAISRELRRQIWTLSIVGAFLVAAVAVAVRI